MTQAKLPPEQPQTREPDRGLRERVRERMRQMAPLALLAATPLTNAACDGVNNDPPSTSRPTPTCEKSPSSWAQFMHTDAAWGTEAGERIVLLTISSPTDKPWLQASSSYTVEGGSLLPSTALKPNVLRIKPDAGASVIHLKGTMTCHIVTEPMAITIDHLSDKNPTVAIDIG
jgi:hypothetical protein